MLREESGGKRFGPSTAEEVAPWPTFRPPRYTRSKYGYDSSYDSRSRF